MKKSNLLIAALFVFVVGMLPACELLEECGTCVLVTVDSDGNETLGTPLPYCGDNLVEKQNSSPVTVGGITTYWDCY
ncbi:MAG: hypothetical protein KAT15_17210 [Bacteroidales bacterium]|nr:hypothetical protein [Bacteroidales bacterium]